MTKPAEPRVPYPTADQFWRAYQTKERPADLAARENQTTIALKQAIIEL